MRDCTEKSSHLQATLLQGSKKYEISADEKLQIERDIEGQIQKLWQQMCHSSICDSPTINSLQNAHKWVKAALSENNSSNDV
jgi:hypothetical protein